MALAQQGAYQPGNFILVRRWRFSFLASCDPMPVALHVAEGVFREFDGKFTHLLTCLNSSRWDRHGFESLWAHNLAQTRVDDGRNIPNAAQRRSSALEGMGR